ncbi:GumC family protein [Parasphingorhabdus sp.]|uniref:GumC family protein n=1 Tax=Parasphingorhabdus sp. TaxID=2709688 RepID=UPI003A947272
MDKQYTPLPDSNSQIHNDGTALRIGENSTENNTYSSEQLGLFNFSAMLIAVYRSKNWIVGIVTACVLVGIVVSILTSPIYESSASIQIDQQAAQVTGTEDSDVTASIQDSDRFLQTQVDVVKSRALAITVAEDENLFNNPEFLEAMNVSRDIEAVGSLSQEDAEREAVLEVLKENLNVSLPVDSRIAAIRFRSPDPVLAARLANSFAENFIQDNLQRKFDQSSYAREFLKGQLDVAAAQLAESESKSLNYARRTRIIDATNSASEETGDSPRSLILSTLVRLNEELAVATSRRIEAQQKWEVAKRVAPLDMQEVLANQAVQRLLEERAKAEANQKQLLERFKAGYPQVRQLSAQLQELSNQISAISSSIKASVRDEYRTAAAQEAKLKSEIARMKGAVLDEQSQSIQLGLLKRAVKTDRELYELLLNRYNELNAQAGVQANNVAILDQAVPPSDPIEPNIPLNLLLALFAGFAVSAGFIFVREQIFETIRSPDDVSQKLDMRAIGVIPEVSDDTDMLDEIQDPKSHVSEAYATLRTSLGLALPQGLPKSIMFTSASASEGKSLSVYATAAALGRANKSVLVVDFDFRRPNQHKLFKIENNRGMSDVLAHNAVSEDVTSTTIFNNVKCIGSGPNPPNPVELIAADSTRNIIDKLMSEYDVVLLDCPPLLGLADAVVLGSLAESCVFVIESNRNQTSVVKTAINRLKQSNVKIIGILLNKVNIISIGYSNSSYSYEYKSNE